LVSILVVQLVPEGLLFGADRNVTVEVPQGSVVASGQSPRPKVHRWPNREVVIGYVGRAEIAGQPTDEWLYSFIGHNVHRDLEELPHELNGALVRDLGSRVGDSELVIHLGGFVADRGQWKPQVWYIRNTRGMDELGRPLEIVGEFDVSEELEQPQYPFHGKTGSEMRDVARARAEAWNPFWFHQGRDLGTFNTLDAVLRFGMRALVETHPGRPHRFPDTLSEWSKHLKMAILGYGAYFAAFYEPFKQYVGGGADVVSAGWPRLPPPA
jgi:hypothetical protein